jgi:hypothetical protein
MKNRRALYRGFINVTHVFIFATFLLSISIGVVVGMRIAMKLEKQASRSWCNSVLEYALKKFDK